MAESLKNKTVKGIGWSAADAFLGQGVTFLVGIVLARILSPAEYGLIGICLIFTTVLSGVVDSGFSTALIRKIDATDDDYNTMFITNMLMSVLLFVLLYLCAPIIAFFFERSELIVLVRVMGLLLIIQALSITQVTILSKRLDFKTKTKASVIAAILSGFIGIGMAYAGNGVWALVGQQLSNKLTYSLSLWMFNHWRPKGSFCRASFHYMWGFGWKMMLSGILANLWNQVYQIVVGKCYSPATLGQYSRAKEYGSLFSAHIAGLVQKVTYPVLCNLQDDQERMLAAYRRIIKVTMLITATLMLFMGAVAEPMVYCLIGPKWHEAATYLPLICISLSIYPLHSINLNMLQVQGRSDIFLVLEIVKKVISIGPLCLGIFVNIYWMLVGSIVIGVISFFLNSYYTGRNLKYSSWRQLKDIAPSYGVACIVGLSIHFLKYLPTSYWTILLMQVLLGLILFIFLCECTKLDEYTEIKNIVISFIQKKLYKKNL